MENKRFIYNIEIIKHQKSCQEYLLEQEQVTTDGKKKSESSVIIFYCEPERSLPLICPF